MSWVVDCIEEHIIIENKLYASLNFPYIFLPTSFNQNGTILSRCLIKKMVHIKLFQVKGKKKFCATLSWRMQTKEDMHMWCTHQNAFRDCASALCEHTKHPVAWTTKTFIKHLRCLIMNVSYVCCMQFTIENAFNYAIQNIDVS